MRRRCRARWKNFAADTSVAGGEIWIALDAAGMPVSMEEKLRGGDKKIAGALMIDTLYQEDAEAVGAQLAKQFPQRRYRHLSRALPNRDGVIYESAAAAGGDDRAAPDRAPRDHRHRRILDRRT